MNWDLQNLYNGFDDPDYLRDIKVFQDLTAALLDRARALDIGVDRLEDILRDAQSMTALEMKTFFYALLTLAADANNGPARAAYDRLMPSINQVEQFYSALSARLEKADLESLTASSPLISQPMRRISSVITVGAMDGSVMLNILRQRPAPSTTAAS